MINKQCKKEKTIERVVKIVVLALTIGVCIILGSCEPVMCEDCYTYTYSDGSTDWVCVEYDCSTDNYAQDLGFTKANTLSGQYENYETLVDGVVYERDFDAYWEFTANAVRFQEDRGGDIGIVTYNQVAISRYEGNTLYTLAGTTEIPYEFTIEDNGDIIITHMSGDYVITYKLSN